MRTRTNRRGGKYAFARLSDRSGAFEVALFSETLAEARPLLESGRALLVRADARMEDDAPRLAANRVEALEEAVSKAARGLKIYLRDPGPVATLARVLDGRERGRGRVRLVVRTPDREVDMLLPEAYRIDAGIRSAVKSLPGVVDVRDI